MPATGSGSSPAAAENPPCSGAWQAPWKREDEITRSRGLTIGYVGQHVPGQQTGYLVPAISHSQKLPSVVLQFP